MSGFLRRFVTKERYFNNTFRDISLLKLSSNRRKFGKKAKDAASQHAAISEFLDIEKRNATAERRNPTR